MLSKLRTAAYWTLYTAGCWLAIYVAFCMLRGAMDALSGGG